MGMPDTPDDVVEHLMEALEKAAGSTDLYYTPKTLDELRICVRRGAESLARFVGFDREDIEYAGNQMTEQFNAWFEKGKAKGRIRLTH